MNVMPSVISFLGKGACWIRLPRKSEVPHTRSRHAISMRQVREESIGIVSINLWRLCLSAAQ